MLVEVVVTIVVLTVLIVYAVVGIERREPVQDPVSEQLPVPREILAPRQLLVPRDDNELIAIRCLLESQGIPYRVPNEHFGTLYPGPGNFALNERAIFVDESDYETATALILEDRQEQQKATEDLSSGTITEDVQTDMTKLFRYLVVISAILFIILWMISYVDHNWLSEAEAKLLRADNYGSHIPNTRFIYWTYFIGWLVLYVGLFFYVRIARTSFFVLMVGSAIATFFWGFRVYAPYEAALSNIVTLTDGAILAIAYLTPVSDKFKAG